MRPRPVVGAPYSRPMAAVPAGLCERCAHRRLVATTRGPAYSLCERSRSEPERYPRYPRLPVLRCEGFDPAPAPADAGGALT